MKNVIKGQVAMLVALLTAFAVTLSACGGGSSSAGGGSAVRTASVSGTVTNNGVAGLEIRSSSGLIATLSDIFIPVAHAGGVSNVSVVVICPDPGGGTYSDSTDVNGRFKVDVDNIGTGVCTTSFNGAPGPNVNVDAGMETEVTVALEGGSVKLVSMNQSDDDSTEVEIQVTDGQGSADIASSDDGVSDSASEDGVSEDNDSVSEDDGSDNDDKDSGDDVSGNDDTDSGDDDDSKEKV
jgi:hypothetical protein